jgi:hypothetical protein
MYTRGYRVLLCDGDLSPLPVKYVRKLARPYRGRLADMMLIGVPDFTQNVPWAKPGGLWRHLSGVRSLPRWMLYELVGEGLLFGYTVEVMLNMQASHSGSVVRTFSMRGVKGQERFGTDRRTQMELDFKWLESRKDDINRLWPADNHPKGTVSPV